jgi:hypothetical protein
VELHFRDDQKLHEERLSRGEPPQRVKLSEIMRMIIQAHASEIKFREWNAGTKIDSQMKD